MVWTLLGAADEKKKRKILKRRKKQIRILQHFSRSTVAPIGAKKKCKHFSSPRKKEHLEDFTAEEVVRRRKGKKKDQEVVEVLRGVGDS